MGREKELNDILDQCLDRLMFKGDTVELCLADYPQYADELKPLLEASLITNRISSLEPDQAFKAKARNELFTALKEAEVKKSQSIFKFGSQPLWARLVAVIVVLLIATGGTAAASIGSMPDDFLYPVKRATEQVQLAFTFTNLGKAEAYARMANRRVEEIIFMANEDNLDDIEVLATSLDSNLKNIAEYSLREDSADRGTSADEGAMVFSEKAVMTESEAAANDQSLAATGGETSENDEDTVVEETVGEDSTPSAITVEPTKPEVTTELPPTNFFIEPSFGQLLTKRDELNVLIINQANTNIQHLYELLSSVPESTREIILKAIQISEQGYGIAIDSLNTK